MLTLGALLLVLAGCGQPPKTATDEAAPPSTQPAVESGDDVAQPGSTTKPAPEAKAPVAVVEVPEFLDAAFLGNVATVQKALGAGVDVNSVDEERRTPLMLAAFNGHTPVVELLLKAGALPNERDAAGRTPLMFAATGDNAATVAVLLDAGAEVNAVDAEEKFTALMHAAAEGQAKVVEVLLERKADPDLRDVDGDTAKDFATQNGHAEVVRLLTK